jgi:O-antigen/teichoic acid export membrane protein
MRILLLSALPLGATAALVSLTMNIPRYVISAVHDRKMLGLFASVAVILQAGALIFRAIEQPAMPRLAKLISERDAFGFWRLLFRLCCLFTGVAAINVVLSLLVGTQVLTLLFNDNFADLGGVLALMALATAVSQMAGLVESSLIAARVTAVQVPMHVITVLSCLVLCQWLVPSTQLYGAVLAVAVCRFPFMLIGVWLLRQKLSEPIVVKKIETVPDDRLPKHAVDKRMAA